jgi:serine/threonine-protein kinase RsbW
MASSMLHWSGGSTRRVSPTGHRIDAHPIRLRFSGTPRGFEQSFLRLRGALDGAPLKLDVRTRYNIELVFEEIVGNMVRYAAPQSGELSVAVSVDISVDRIVMTFEDDGIPFDPCRRSDAVVPRTLVEATDGGFGLKIVRRFASSMRYERAANQNRLVVTLAAL